MSLRCISALILVLLLAPAPALAQEDRVALVIGNGAYTGTTQLANPPNDARAVGEALEAVGFETIVVVDGDKLEMERAIRAFSNLLAGADVGLFFYAGHGLQVNGRNYILPTNAELIQEQDLRFEAIDVELPLMRWIPLEGRRRLSIARLSATMRRSLAAPSPSAGGWGQRPLSTASSLTTPPAT